MNIKSIRVRSYRGIAAYKTPNEYLVAREAV